MIEDKLKLIQVQEHMVEAKWGLYKYWRLKLNDSLRPTIEAKLGLFKDSYLKLNENYMNTHD